MFGSRSSGRAAAAPARPAPAPRAAPQAAPQQGGGMMSGMGGMMMTGMALGAGSEIGHRAIGAVMGPRDGGHHQENAPMQAEGS